MMRADASEHWIENRPSVGRLPRVRLGDVWSHRELAFFFAWRDIKLRYKQTVLGVMWAVLQPLIAMILFSTLLERAAHIPSQGIAYPVFAYIGLAAWVAFTTAVSRAAESLTEDPSLVTNVFFPRVLAPIGATLPIVLDLALGLSVAVPLMAAYGVGPGDAIALVPVCAVGIGLVAAATGVWLSALNVLYRDFRYALSFGLQAWLFATPVLFPSSIVHGAARDILFVNPAAGMIEAFRGCVLGTPVNGGGVAISAGALVLLGTTGLMYFGRVERVFADRI